MCTLNLAARLATSFHLVRVVSLIYPHVYSSLFSRKNLVRIWLFPTNQAAVALWVAASRPAAENELLTLVAPIPSDIRLPIDQMGVLALSPDG